MFLDYEIENMNQCNYLLDGNYKNSALTLLRQNNYFCNEDLFKNNCKMNSAIYYRKFNFNNDGFDDNKLKSFSTYNDEELVSSHSLKTQNNQKSYQEKSFFKQQQGFEKKSSEPAKKNLNKFTSFPQHFNKPIALDDSLSLNFSTQPKDKSSDEIQTNKMAACLKILTGNSNALPSQLDEIPLLRTNCDNSTSSTATNNKISVKK